MTARPQDQPAEPGGQLLVPGERPDTRDRYGADERHEAERLFEPPPAPMPGQTEMFNPDESEDE